jgi:K+-transporting ATPase ATPase C chain
VLNTLRSAALMFLVLTAVTGVAYPAVVTLLAQAFFPHQANGSLIYEPTDSDEDGIAATPLGSELIGQQFSADRYFWGRPSATSPVPYNAAASTGSNYGPTNPTQIEAVKQRVDHLRATSGGESLPVPIDLVTASASGLDPHISPAAAEYQVPRIARARSLGDDVVRRVLAENVEGRELSVLGEPRVNVLRLNLALDRLHP